MIDTHTHLYLDDFGGAAGGEAAVDRALAAGVEMMVMPNVDLSTVAPMRKLHEARPAVTVMAMGLHPTEVTDGWARDLDCVIAELQRHRADYKAVGEVGMDLYWSRSHSLQQSLAFAEQAALADALDLPIIVHCREALQETLSVLRRVRPRVPVIFHSFTGGAAEVECIRRDVADAWFGINGVVTFRNCRLRETLPLIGAGRLLTETDSPYLAPVPLRGKRNESAYIVHTLRHMAAAMGMTPEALDEVTTANARSIFAL